MQIPWELKVFRVPAMQNPIFDTLKTDHEFLFAATFCTLDVFHISSPPPPSTYASHYQGLSITAITGTYTISFSGKRPNLLIYLLIAMNTHDAEIISLKKTKKLATQSNYEKSFESARSF